MTVERRALQRISTYLRGAVLAACPLATGSGSQGLHQETPCQTFLSPLAFGGGVPERKPHHQTTGGGSAMASGPKKREMVQCKTKNRNRASPQKYTSGRPWSNADHQTLSRLGTSRRRGLGTAQKRTAERDPERTTRPTLSSGLGTAQRSRLDTRKAAHPDLILEIKSRTRVVAFTGARRTGHRVPRGPSARPPPRGEGAPGASA